MNALLIAQGMAGFTLIHWIVICIVLIAVVAIALAYCRHAGVTIPPFLVTVFWIVVGAIIAIAAIKILLSLV